MSYNECSIPDCASEAPSEAPRESKVFSKLNEIDKQVEYLSNILEPIINANSVGCEEKEAETGTVLEFRLRKISSRLADIIETVEL